MHLIIWKCSDNPTRNYRANPLLKGIHPPTMNIFKFPGTYYFIAIRGYPLLLRDTFPSYNLIRLIHVLFYSHLPTCSLPDEIQITKPTQNN